jgi:hypothetical protein
MSIRGGGIEGAERVSGRDEDVLTTGNLLKEAGTTDWSAASVDVICFSVFQMKTGIMTVDTTAGCITTNPVCIQPMIAVRSLRQTQAIVTHLSLATSFPFQRSDLSSEAKPHVSNSIVNYRDVLTA